MTTASTPKARLSSTTICNSSSVSVANRLTATIGRRPKAPMLSTCLARFSIPCLMVVGSGRVTSATGVPPCILSALTVATNTTAAGHTPAVRHLTLRNFSPPRSKPKPASVIT